MPIQRPEQEHNLPEGAELIVGRNPVREALKQGVEIDAVYVKAREQERSDGKPNGNGSLGAILNLCKQRGVTVKQVAPQKLDRLSGGVPHQGVVATCAAITYCALEDLLQQLRERATPPLLLLCDEIADPHNLGAILRTAEATGVDGVIIPKRRSVGVTQTVHKTSAGAASVIPVCRVTNLAQTIKTLKKHNIFIYCAEMDGTPWCEQDYTGGVALLIGSEGYGVSPLLQKESDFRVSLPMCGTINSLNASVATGVLLYEIVRQRLGTPR